MTNFELNRRQLLKAAGLAAGTTMLSFPAFAKEDKRKAMPDFKYSLNMSTIRGQQLGFIKELEVASKAGFRSVEIWIDTFMKYLQDGGNVTTAKKVIDDLGLTIENAIGFAKWIVDDEKVRAEGLKQLQHEMELLAKIGCKRVAAPPFGANGADAGILDLNVIVGRYQTILEMGRNTGVMPILEMWGGSTNLKKISQVIYVATECGETDARVLLDTFHIFKGGSSFESAPLVGRKAMEILHINDYPAGIAPAKISEPDRVYPGDGIAPLKPLLKQLRNPANPIILSLEVFNPNYYKQDALLVAKTGLAKMKEVTSNLG
ncbi:sugar phosphate isomerase/epimerase [Chitinophaga silvatica]|uniref:Sugar phosphate isomerase/epimerase n=1 Tax=Chitinophaga silvatica TaxID=2282649 RepID=A0A3E1Y5E2_9BACT|nr:sugar phosphate isomerase/epimerase family protein [Chitinophaga silvatica]RFS19960.1 sugar phosphate isomerase/epimerase [Chitinophaga silvatica]